MQRQLKKSHKDARKPNKKPPVVDICSIMDCICIDISAAEAAWCCKYAVGKICGLLCAKIFLGLFINQPKHRPAPHLIRGIHPFVNSLQTWKHFLQAALVILHIPLIILFQDQSANLDSEQNA